MDWKVCVWFGLQVLFSQTRSVPSKGALVWPRECGWTESGNPFIAVSTEKGVSGILESCAWVASSPSPFDSSWLVSDKRMFQTVTVSSGEIRSPGIMSAGGENTLLQLTKSVQ